MLIELSMCLYYNSYPYFCDLCAKTVCFKTNNAFGMQIIELKVRYNNNRAHIKDNGCDLIYTNI